MKEIDKRPVLARVAKGSLLNICKICQRNPAEGRSLTKREG